MHHSPIHYQLDAKERKLLAAYDYEILDVESPNQLDLAKEKVLQGTYHNSEWQGGSPEWLDSLHAALIEHMQGFIARDEEISRSMLSSYLIHIDTGYSGFAGMLDDEVMPRMAGVIEDGIDINATHLAWLHTIDEKLNTLVAGGADEYMAFRYLNQAFELDLSFDKYQELYDEYKHYGMTVRQYLEWYVRSDANMNDDQPTIEFAQGVGRSLGVWCPDGDLTARGLSAMNRNYQIHPQHRDDMKTWAEKAVKVTHESDNNNSMTQ